MDRVFHVFVSSTYVDLIEERKAVSASLSKAGYVAEGMEIFPASSQKQMDFISKVIDRCDYYILILGNRYGTLSDSGISYTEMEYEYALSKGIPVLSFIRNAEASPEVDEALAAFKTRVSTGTLVDFWDGPHDLAARALAAISQARQSHPGVGWVRADKIASEELLAEVRNLRKINDDLQKKQEYWFANNKIDSKNLADLEDKISIRYTHKISGYAAKKDKLLDLTWINLFRIISPAYRVPTNTIGCENLLSRFIREESGLAASDDSVTINMIDKERILIHLEALGLLSSQVFATTGGGQAVFHKLTPAGTKLMLELNSVRKG